METNAKAEAVIERRGWCSRGKPPIELPEVSRFWCSVLFLLSMVCLAITASGNVQFAGDMGLSDHAKQTLIAQALAIDGFAVALCAVSGVLWFGRRWVGSLVVLVFATAYVVFSANGLVGFGIGERLGSTLVAEANQAEAKEAAKIANDALLKGRQELLTTLKQRFNSTRDARERAIIINELAKAAAAPVELKTVKIEKVAVDGQAKAYGRVLGYSAETVQMALMTGYGILVVLGKILGAWCATAFWPKKPLRLFRRRKREEEPAAVLTVEAVPAAAPALPGPAKAATIDLDRARDMALVKEWLDTCIVRVPRTHTEKAEAVYGWFQAWCQNTKKLGSVMTQTCFGRLTAELDLPKEKKGSRVVYRGLMRKGASAIPAATSTLAARRKAVA